jgi:transposase
MGFETMRTYEELLAENAALKAQVAALLARVAALEARLGMDSRNSSKPPSSDPPNVAARPKRGPSGRRRGGQPGHKGTTRALLPPERVHAIIELKPEECERCGRALSGDDPKPKRRQVIDVPPVEPEVTE